MNFIGIDNGLTGGIAIINGPNLRLHVMPVESDGRKNHVDAIGLNLMLGLYADAEPFVVYEKPAGSRSAKAGISMAASFACVDTVLKLNSIRREPITARKWQKMFWLPKKGLDTKKAALKVARELWPGQDWRKNERCRKPHDGLVDAALIAEYCRRTYGT